MAQENYQAGSQFMDFTRLEYFIFASRRVKRIPRTKSQRFSSRKWISCDPVLWECCVFGNTSRLQKGVVDGSGMLSVGRQKER